MADISQTAANVVAVTVANGIKRISGATITAGEPVYLDANTSTMKLCKADAAATANCIGIAMCGASSGQPVIYLPTDKGGINLGATLTVGQTYVVSAANAGKIAPISDLNTNNYVTILGVATTSSNLDMEIINSGAVKP